MRYALIIAGGSGTRLWPMSTKQLPKQLIPFIGGRSLLSIAMERLEGLLPNEQIYICAGESHRQVMLDKLPGLTPDRFIAEPMGRDTLNAVALGTGVLHKKDPDATVAIFTADHIIEPEDKFRRIVERGFELAEQRKQTLVTFGIEPTHAATGYGYLQLGEPVEAHDARVVNQFKEKPDEATAEQYFAAGAEKYLWNSGMFVWNAAALMDCVHRFVPKNFEQLQTVIDAWDTPEQEQTLHAVYPELEKISVDYAVMEPAAQDDQVQVAAIPMPLKWLDVGSWPAYAQACESDENSNVVEGVQALAMDSESLTIVGDQKDHLIATIGCENLVIIHTAKSTLICPADQAQKIKQMQGMVKDVFGEDYV